MNMFRVLEKIRVKVIIPVLIACFIAALTSWVPSAYSQNESIIVECFKENFEAGNNLGNVTVTKPETAGKNCNQTYYDCEGKCIGCYYDQTLAINICYDNDGKKITI